MVNGRIVSAEKSNRHYIWPVRSTDEKNSPCPIPKTGQTTSYHRGDDGYLKRGKRWPAPRFTDNGDGTVFDNLTGLEWVGGPHYLSGNYNRKMHWNDAIDFCHSLSYAGYDNWRLPSIRELESLLHLGKGSWGDQPYAWLNSSETPFYGIVNASPYSSMYLSSTTDKSDAVSWGLDMSDSRISTSGTGYVWPVRTPERHFDFTDNGSTISESDFRDYTLAVFPKGRGNPTPAEGIITQCWHATVACSAGSETGYTCIGWTGTGSVPKKGYTTSTEITLTEPASSIAWDWRVDTGELIVTNVTASQRPGTKQVEITYDTLSSRTNVVSVSLKISNGAKTLSSRNASGDIGEEVTPGTNKTILWDGGADWNGNVAELVYTIITEDTHSKTSSSFPCPVSKTGQTTSYQTGDDGELQSGLAWPTLRFTDNGDGTVTDNLTNLQWVKAPHSLAGNSSSANWDHAIDYCQALSFAGFSDWRLPSIKELVSMINYGSHNPALPVGHPFSGLDNSRYWSGTSAADPSSWAHAVFLQDGYASYNPKHYPGHIWPVRSTKQTKENAPVPKTGTETSYRPGDDGNLKSGTSWPSPRFTDLGNGSAIDNLTGLEWAKAPHAISGNSSRMAWSEAINFCNSLSLAGHDDWRLPNIKELESLVNYGKGSWGDRPNEWLNSTEAPFTDAQYDYWSCTSLAEDSALAWLMLLSRGETLPIEKNITGYSESYVWPVRTPEQNLSAMGIGRATETTDSRDYTLEVISTHGTPIPSAGTHSNYCWGSTVKCTAGIERDLYLNGWIGTGSVPPSGETTNVLITLTDVASSITWNWTSTLAGFAQWAIDEGLSGDPAILFKQDRDGDGVANGLEYAFGTNELILSIIANGSRPIVETPEQDPATVPYVNTRVRGSADLKDWDLMIYPQSGAPAGRQWFTTRKYHGDKAFFRLEAELK